MKGIVLAGGLGTRLRPLTYLTNKHLLPIYDRPLIYYPLSRLLAAGIEDVLIITCPEHVEQFEKLFALEENMQCNLSYMAQEKPGGIAQGLALAEDFAADENIALILGDNIFAEDFGKAIQNFSHGAELFLKAVPDPERFGIAELNSAGEVTALAEKPSAPKSNLAVTGFYLYDHTAFDRIRTLAPSARGELEITDLNLSYLCDQQIRAILLSDLWLDAGTFDSMLRASELAREKLIPRPF